MKKEFFSLKEAHGNLGSGNFYVSFPESFASMA